MMESSLNNQSGLRPKGHAVLVKPFEEVQKKASLIAIPQHVKDRQLLLEDKVTVIEVGPMAWHDEKEPRAVPGDVVLISQFAGHMAVSPKDGQQYRLVNARDIFAVVEEN